MLIDFQKPILDINGKQIKRVLQDGSAIKDDAGNETVLTLLNVCQEALSHTYQDEQGITGAKKNERFLLIMKIGKDKLPVEITVAENALIQELVGKAYEPPIVGRVYEILENKKE